MDEYISRHEAIRAVQLSYGNYEAIRKAIFELPVADVAPVVHGEWIERQTPHAMGGISAKCSVCTKSVQYLGNPLNYCPNCGAKMDGAE